MPLKQAIQDAFADVPRPGDDQLTDCPYHCRECRRIEEYFKGKTWMELGVAEIQGYHLALSLFTTEAAHYFMPAFMLASLESEERGSVIVDAIRFYFEYAAEYHDSFPVRLGRFTPKQRAVIIDFLTHMERLGAGSSEHAIGMLGEESAYA